MAKPAAKRAPSRARNERFEARISKDQKSLFQQAADLEGRSITDFVLHSAHEAALKAIERMRIIRLSERDSKIFVEALLNPPEPNLKFQEAARRYLERYGNE